MVSAPSNGGLGFTLPGYFFDILQQKRDFVKKKSKWKKLKEKWRPIYRDDDGGNI